MANVPRWMAELGSGRLDVSRSGCAAEHQAPIFEFFSQNRILGSIVAATDRNSGNLAEIKTGIKFRKISPKPEFRN
jgi:hypothetical protein